MRFLPPALVFLGTVLFAFGLMASLWIVPQVAQAPIDQQSRTVSTGAGSYYNFASGEQVESDQIRSVINTQSDQSVYEGEDPLSDDLAVYDQTSGLFDDATGTEITYSESRIAIDRESALPVECCDADADIDGLTIKWPFDVGQRDYPLWDGTLGDVTTATFAGEEDIDGLTVYRFEVDVPASDTGPASEDAEFPRVMYESTKVYLVEPVTGRIIDSQQDVHRYVVDESGETVIDAADVSLGVSPETVADSVALAKDQTSQLALLDTLSWLGPVLGFVLLLIGVLLFRRPGEETEEAGPAMSASDPDAEFHTTA